jgi:hypothetical protein
MLITDGHSSKTASVTNSNRLNVKSSSVPEAQIISIQKEFTFIAEQLFTASGTLDGYVQTLVNLDPSRRIVVLGVEIDLDAVVAGGTVTIARNPNIDTPNLTNNTTIDPINLNFGSGKQGLVQSVGHDGVGTGIGGITDDILFAPKSLAVRTEIDITFGGLVILSQGDELGIKMDTLAATPVVTTSITYYLLEEGN